MSNPVPPPPPPMSRPYSSFDHRPHYENIPPPPALNLQSPQPKRMDPNLPAHMASQLETQAAYYTPSLPPGASQGLTPGLGYQPQVQQTVRAHSPMPAPNANSDWTPWALPPNPYQQQQPNQYQPQQQVPYNSPPQFSLPYPYPPQQPYNGNLAPNQYPPATSLSHGMANLSFNSTQPLSPHSRSPSVHSTYGPVPQEPTAPRQTSSQSQSLTAPLPTITALTAASSTIQNSATDPSTQIAWCRDVLFLIDRIQQNASTDTPVGPALIPDPQLSQLASIAVPLILQVAANPSNPISPEQAEALYHRATFAASGAYPDHIRQNPRAAFRDFETAARGGYAAAWFRLGRDYENFNDVAHARDCFERGVKLGVESCAYRMGMAHLMGQLGLSANAESAVPLLHRAATLASLDVPQPAYVYGLLLLAEFSHVTIPPSLFQPYIPQGSTPTDEARKHLERAAYLSFAPAQYKLGHAYEFAQPPFPFDALLSVQYYSLASQQGEIEADMALSKWFLCGSEGGFDKDEVLAFTFAEKAARKGLPSAEFAMGYYAEVGVGGPKDIDTAIKWYRKASEHGNSDATDRLKALSQPTPQALSRQEHDAITENKLVRTRTQAKQRSDAVGPNPGHGPRRGTDGRQVIEIIRKNSLANRPPMTSHQTSSHLPTMSEHDDPYAQQQQQPQRRGPSRSPNPSSTPRIGAPMRTTSPSSYNSGPQGPAYNQGPPPSQASSYNQGPPPAAQGPGRAMPGASRYSLVDPGSHSASSPARVASPPGAGAGAGRGAGRVSAAASQPTPPQPAQHVDDFSSRPPPPKGPTTFAEMGFQGAKAEKSDCVIM